MGFAVELGEGYAALLAGAGVGRWIAPGSTAIYSASDVGISVRDILPSPDATITLTPCRIDDGIGTADATWGLQVRCRGAGEGDAYDLSEAVWAVLHGRRDYRVGTISVVLSYRQSGTTMGQDALGRFEWSDNYMIMLMRPTALNGE